jgi:hypothetical protein
MSPKSVSSDLIKDMQAATACVWAILKYLIATTLSKLDIMIGISTPPVVAELSTFNIL